MWSVQKNRPPFRSIPGRAILGCIAAVALAGCQTVSLYTSEHLDRDRSAPRILLMPMDISLSSVAAGGQEEPNAQWTEAAKGHAEKAIFRFLKDNDIDAVTYRRDGALTSDTETAQLIKLHGAVGSTIVEHHFGQSARLPNKEDTFDWTLGELARHLARESAADYALFIHVRDSYADAGRVAVIVLSGVLFGAYVSGGQQVGFASLVDVETGRIVWFNRLLRGAGDLRQYEPAAETISLLLQDFPS